ncbi:holo-ACP synthase [Tengunoibacter tsumagoiensis]|uniref:Holo-[acyl-carrier-protein] synthase n=1 Tax=Tengunoibacter tsumagoiensis TaxID=2014871 RepID=A0A402A6Z6_9CHLR|nr:holo-ACP synthase [Tengunoibacter tsumagoiensis]GCE14917.1 holo-[acyl-carrier-protein] synthase [Tengunoibacter tsumagoiensis]
MQTSSSTHVRVGVDLVDVARLTRFALEHSTELATVFTERELTYCRLKRRCYEHMAARFAAKEAVLKAFGTGMGQGMCWTDVEVVSEGTGRPRVLLHGYVADYAQKRGLLELDISLSHTTGMAIAQVITVWQKRREE